MLKIAPSNDIPDLFFAYLVVPPLGVVIIAYIIEMIEKNNLLRHQLIIAEKLEAIEQMGAAISHEIRNPLTTALGFVELLHKDNHDMEKRTQYLAILKDELDSAERIIQDYLSYSKPILESVEPLNVQEELMHVIKLLQPLANYHSVKLSTNFSSTRLMEGDRSKFQQCFINIIKNSIESRPNGGTLLIEAVETTTHIVITIQDNETSICSEELKQKDFSMTLSFSIVRAMKGTIDEVKRENGKGEFLKFSFKPIKPHLKR
ncbi:HAMP domain-containing sensor histidine kinase [Psychrobacillus sp. FSL H8-0483]|uniref:HAMP domain-containing sensor histidine kinase n=1 Tax=Psychrobacillus sp. FSL H8-0483 TaxID=2921389 RepID=UPI00315AD34C